MSQATPESDRGIRLERGDGDWSAWLSCPACGGIVHVRDVDYPYGARGSLSGDGVRIWMACEGGHRFALWTEDHSGTMSLNMTRVRPDAEPDS